MKRAIQLLIFILLTGCAKMPASSTTTPHSNPTSQPDIFLANQRLARTVNLGDAMEAPNEGEWGVTLQADYFQIIAQAGFTAVRIPIRFSAHARDNPPYQLDPIFLARADWAIDTAIANGLVAIVDMHHYVELIAAPEAHQARFLALWQQLAEHYKNYPDGQVYFELLNEPHDTLTDAIWNGIMAEVLPLVRQTNPTRPIIVGAGGWNSSSYLYNLQLPDDHNLIVTFHYYLPMEFTHQGAGWVGGSDAWLGTTWTGTPAELTALKSDFDLAAIWAKQNNRPLFLGEFGAYSKGDLASRVRWTAAIRQASEERGFSWGYWEFCSGFGVYDPSARQWRTDLLEALIPKL